MKVKFKNIADDIDALLTIDGKEISICQSDEYECDIDKNEIEFSVHYDRDFSLETTDEKTDKFVDFLGGTIGNVFVRIKNTYRISDLMDGDIIELNERSHYVPTTKREAFYKCLPALYYFGEAECEKAKIEIVSSNAMNSDEFLKLYKKVFKLFNLSGYFRIIKYKKQVKRQKRISSDETLTQTFKMLYALSDDEREYQFSR